MFYHMFGRTIGKLTVYTRNYNGGPLKPVWTKSGNVGDFYERTDIQIFEQQTFQVSFHSNLHTKKIETDVQRTQSKIDTI